MYVFHLWLEKRDAFYDVICKDPNDIVYLLDRCPTLTIVDIEKKEIE